jgi:hypothetical protein
MDTKRAGGVVVVAISIEAQTSETRRKWMNTTCVVCTVDVGFTTVEHMSETRRSS